MLQISDALMYEVKVSERISCVEKFINIVNYEFLANPIILIKIAKY